MDYDELKEDIRKHGITQPLIALRSGQIVNGYRRFQIANDLGIQMVPVVFLDQKPEQVQLRILYTVVTDKDSTGND